MDIVKRDQTLPATVDELSKFVLIGREKLVSVRAEMRAIDKLHLATGVREQKKEEAQMLAEALLDAEIKLGELLREHAITSVRDEEIKPGRPKTLPEGISWNQSSQFQKMADHIEVVEQVKAEARERDELPTRTEAIRTIKQVEREAQREQVIDIPLPSDKYRILYADPPWQYSDSGIIGNDNYGRAERHYPTLSITELCEYKDKEGKQIKDLSLDNAVLFLWVTSPILEESFRVINAWGFQYKTSFVWDKVLHNFGHYNSVRHEFLLVCTKGSCLPDSKELIDSVQSIEKSRIHSQKPKEFRAIIDKLYTHGKRVELFSRTKAEGWDIWPKEI